MSLSVLGLVLSAALCHATWNAFVKASDDRLAGLVSINLIGATAGLLMVPFVPPPDATGWLLIAASVPCGWRVWGVDGAATNSYYGQMLARVEGA